MRAVADVAQHPRLGPLPIPAEAGRLLTGLNPGLLRSAFAGQGNAILLGVGLHPAEHRVLTLNDRRFRRDQARDLAARSDRPAGLGEGAPDLPGDSDTA